MLNAVLYLGALGVVKPVQGSHQISGDSPDALKLRAAVLLGPAALGAGVPDNAGKPAHRVPVHRMVHRAISHSAFLHTADHLFKGLQILGGVPVQLDIGDVSAVGQLMIRGLPFDLVKGGNFIINRDVEGIGVVFPVRHPWNDAVSLLVQPHKPAGKPLGGGGNHGEVQSGPLGLLIHPLAHKADYLQAQVLRLVRFPVVLANQRLQALGQSNKADGQGTVLQNLLQGILRS